MSRHIYFCGSIRGGRQDADLYARIIKQLQSFGTVLTEHVGNKEHKDWDTLDEKFIHDRDLEWLQKSDVVVAEVTQPSLGVGYEIGRAVAWNKKILCLFRPSSGKNLSAMIRGIHNDSSWIVKDYEEEQVPEILKEYFAKV
ncbi:5-hydroxymethyl-dUMP N-hydrolase-like [Ptychodera flava]|uniref:5-hydroxymethyl-dUMP N-hydrolase-like n=1 Tax=Ptychodera flava TaxID=63121 RepID=UPI00396A8B5B